MTVTHTTGTESTDTIDTNVTVRAGDWVDTGPGLDDLIGNYRMRIPTDRYMSADYAAHGTRGGLDAHLAGGRPRSTRSPTPGTGSSTRSTTSRS